MGKRNYKRHLSSKNDKRQIDYRLQRADSIEKKADEYAKREDEESLVKSVSIYMGAMIAYGLTNNQEAMQDLRERTDVPLRKLAKIYGTTKQQVLEEMFDEVAKGLPQLTETRKKHFYREIGAVVGFLGIIGGLFFLSFNITGNSIRDITNLTSNFLGAGLLIIGIIGGFFWIKNKK